MFTKLLLRRGQSLNNIHQQQQRILRLTPTTLAKQLSSSTQVMFGKDDKGGQGGSAGSVRGAGGKFAERETAFENEYFRKLQAEQLGKLKAHLQDEIKHHEDEIKRHQEAIQRHKAKVSDFDKQNK